jgi:Mlc titration factor MtfA (ptsG expression regulator)
MQYPPEPQYEEGALVLAIGLFGIFLWVLIRYFYKGNFYFGNLFIREKPLSISDRSFLREHIVQYGNLNARQRNRFDKRLQWLKQRKRFVFHGAILNPDELRLFVCAIICLLTFGFNRFQLIRSVSRVVIYPTKYYSKINRRHHLGEYNPKLKVLVFSEDTLRTGFKIPNDNINLAVHEIAHALCFETMKLNNWKARKFQYGLRALARLKNDVDFRDILKRTDYFRDYAFENIFEFFAVLTEVFIENPKELNAKFPELYTIVSVMYGYDIKDGILKEKAGNTF